MEKRKFMDEPIVNVKDLSYQYPSGKDWALHNVSFRVEEGEFFGIVGPTGAGKTTLAMCLRGLIPQNFGGKISGSIKIAGVGTMSKTPGELADRVGIVFQNAETQAIGLTVREDLAFGLENMKVTREEMQKRIDRVSKLIGLSEFLEREPWALSGGQKQKLAIGGVLAMEPDVLILDEPTAELDPVSKSSIFDIVRRLQDEGVTIIMIEHEVETLADVADRILVLNEGEIAMIAPPDEAFREVSLFKDVRERVPFVADLMSTLVDQGAVPENRFTSREEEAIAVLKEYLEGENA